MAFVFDREEVRDVGRSVGVKVVGSIRVASILGAVFLAQTAFVSANATDDAVIRADFARHRALGSNDPVETICASHTARFAVASWRGRETGGQDLFARRRGAWRFVVGGGGAIDRAAGFTQFGVPINDARALLRSERNRSTCRRGETVR